MLAWWATMHIFNIHFKWNSLHAQEETKVIEGRCLTVQYQDKVTLRIALAVNISTQKSSLEPDSWSEYIQKNKVTTLETKQYHLRPRYLTRIVLLSYLDSEHVKVITVLGSVQIREQSNIDFTTWIISLTKSYEFKLKGPSFPQIIFIRI